MLTTMTITSFEFALIGGEFPFLRFIASTPTYLNYIKPEKAWGLA